MRKAIDRCHRDGVIKGTVAKDPSKYIIFDENCKNHNFFWSYDCYTDNIFRDI